MPKETVEIIDKACDALGLSFSEFLRQAALEKLERLSLLSTVVRERYNEVKTAV